MSTNNNSFSSNFLITAGYGALVAIGGIIGYMVPLTNWIHCSIWILQLIEIKKKGSRASLIAGGLFGTAIMLSSSLIFKGEPNGLLLSSCMYIQKQKKIILQN